MGTFTFSLGKGLREPCAPFRTAYYFGAELNEPNADDWNCLPEIVDPTAAFDVSGVGSLREVVVALLTIRSATPGTYSITFSWYREADEALLYRYNVALTPLVGGLVYAYSYIGRNPWEIDRNGRYHVNVDVTGPETHFSSRGFDVTGIPMAAPPPGLPPESTSAIVRAADQLSSFFYDIYLQVLDWPWPFWLVASPFYWLSVFSADLAGAFSNFAGWVSEVSAKLANFLSWETLQQLVRGWLPGLESLVSWWSDIYNNVVGIVSTWWSGVSFTVKGWIIAAMETTREWVSASISTIMMQFNALYTSVTQFRALFDDFWTHTLPGLVDFSTLTEWWSGRIFDIQGLIDSAFSTRSTLWAGWQEFRDQVGGFVEDPEAWLLEKLENMIVRFW